MSIPRNLADGDICLVRSSLLSMDWAVRGGSGTRYDPLEVFLVSNHPTTRSPLDSSY